MRKLSSGTHPMLHVSKERSEVMSTATKTVHDILIQGLLDTRNTSSIKTLPRKCWRTENSSTGKQSNNEHFLELLQVGMQLRLYIFFKCGSISENVSCAKCWIHLWFRNHLNQSQAKGILSLSQQPNKTNWLFNSSHQRGMTTGQMMTKWPLTSSQTWKFDQNYYVSLHCPETCK